MQMKWRLLAPNHYRTARASLRWTQAELARRAQGAQTTVRDFENSRHRLHCSTEKLIITALVAAGMILTGDPDAGFGVFRQFPDDDTIL